MLKNLKYLFLAVRSCMVICSNRKRVIKEVAFKMAVEELLLFHKLQKQEEIKVVFKYSGS
jgi:hypothetical protein